jgi:hypothetical protein
VYEKNKVLVYDSRIIQQIDPIYQEPDQTSFIGIRSHFYAPHKMFMGKKFETFWFNIIVILFMTIMLYIPLYFEWTIKLLDSFSWLFMKFGQFSKSLKERKKKVKAVVAQPAAEE